MAPGESSAIDAKLVELPAPPSTVNATLVPAVISYGVLNVNVTSVSDQLLLPA
jgi:hypothetical protein